MITLGRVLNNDTKTFSRFHTVVLKCRYICIITKNLVKISLSILIKFVFLNIVIIMLLKIQNSTNFH